MGDDDPLALLGATSGLGQEQVDLIAGGNAARLLGLT
jgi:aminocarboxymuconate-semialdehyde decarboxylase